MRKRNGIILGERLEKETEKKDFGGSGTKNTG